MSERVDYRFFWTLRRRLEWTDAEVAELLLLVAASEEPLENKRFLVGLILEKLQDDLAQLDAKMSAGHTLFTVPVLGAMIGGVVTLIVSGGAAAGALLAAGTGVGAGMMGLGSYFTRNERRQHLRDQKLKVDRVLYELQS